MSWVNSIVKALQEYQQKQENLTTGYLVLADDRILHFVNKNDWEEQQINFTT